MRSAINTGTKTLLGQLMFASRLHALLLGRSGAVVAFHRVNDAVDSRGLSISRASFEAYCDFFSRHFRVISLASLLDRLARGDSLERHLAITFDDGYRDNFELAAPILERLSLPATFFVVSQWIGTDLVPWWDRELGLRYPWMTWDQVRELRGRGFDIGAHTRTHANLGEINGKAARDEIVGGRLEIERQIREPVDLFAYPYGGQHQMTDANRAIVREAGFRCCCSCYGGLTKAGEDPFHLRRVAITPWYGSPQQFGLELAFETAPLFA
jgi:peptidoglycan/xylan/chitin deacetylase (PgdA/CDA1 family)